MKISRHVLKNGIRVVASPSIDTKSVAIIVIVKTGSRNEEEKIMGISHFLEHMSFKGTEKMPTSLEVSSAIEALGAQYNASTDKETTSYYIKTIEENFEKAVEILKDIVFHSSLNKYEIELEKGVILEEKKMYEENPKMRAEDLFEKFYFKEPRLSQDIIGTEYTIKGLKREDFISYWGKHYLTGNLVLSVAGNIPKNYLEILSSKFGTVKKSNEENWQALGKKEENKNIALEYRNNKQSYLIFGYPGVVFNDKRYIPLTLLSMIMGGGSASRLFQEVRVKRGLAYEIYSSWMALSDDGYLYIKAGIDSERVENGLRVIKDELFKFKDNMTEKELKIAKEMLKGISTFAFENSLKRAEFYAKREIYHTKLETLDQIIKKIDKVSLKEVKDLASFTFSKPPTLAVIGPFKDAEKFAKIIQ